MQSKDDNDHILKQEMERLREDILKAYNESGKRTTGEFERGLETLYQPNKAILHGFQYLSGRRAGRQPPTQAILNWLKAKGIQPIEKEMSISSLAFLIARKIGREGTKKENNLPIYSQVITPERIDEILNKITAINVSRFIADIEGYITKAFNEYQ